MTDIQALTFDVFGTVVDWRGSIIREGEQVWKVLSIDVDWAQFADDWRAGYQPAMAKVRSGAIPWANIDTLHRQILDDLLARYHITHLTDAQIDDLNRVWHRLDPWPDAVDGLNRLRQRHIVATLSNGNVALLVNMAKRAGLPWDCVLSAELARHYKPDPTVYQMAADLLGLSTGQVMMVAAHKSDLFAAQKVGMKTAFVRRLLEYGPDGRPDRETDPSFDYTADSFIQLAEQLGL